MLSTRFKFPVFGSMLLGLFSVAAPSLADQKIFELIEVTGMLSRDNSVYSKVPKLSIDREDIEIIKPGSVTNLLRGLPGVNITQQGGEGGLAFISLRGGEPNFTIVMIDGIKVSDPTNSRGGGFDFSNLDPLLVEKIDVFFGGFSSVYGSGALGGVISIMTYDPELASRTVTLEAGSDEAYATAFKWNGAVADIVGVTLAAVDRRASQSVPGDELERDQFNLRLHSLAKDDFQWSGSWFRSSGDSSGYPEDSGGDELAVIEAPEERRFRQENASLAARWFVSGNWPMDLTASRVVHEEDTDNPGIAEGVLQGVPAITSRSRYERSDVTWVNSYSGDRYVAAFGGEISREEGHYDSVLDFGSPLPASFELTRNNIAVFGEVTVDLAPKLSVNGGLRYHDAEAFSETTGRLAINYAFPDANGKLSFNYGEGFKLPSFFALGHPLIGNTTLQPEFSENISINFERQLLNGRLNLTATYFHNQFDNLVDFDPILFTNVNRSEVVTEGAELQAEFHPTGQVSLDAYVAYTDTEASSGVKLRRRPEWTGGASVRWKINDLTSLGVRGWYVDQFFDSSIPTGLVTLDEHTRFDATLVRKLNDQSELSLVVTNTTDDDFEEAVGFSNPGRQLRMALKINL